MFLHYANSLVRAGHHVTLFTNTLETVFSIDKGLRIKRIPWRGKIGSIIYALLTKFRADLIVADLIAMSVLLSIRNHNIVYLAQDFDESYYNFCLSRFFIKCLYQWGLGHKKIPVISVADSLVDELNRFRPAWIKVIKNGVDKRIFYPEPDIAYLSKKGTKKSLLILARHDARKGLDVAAACAAYLRKKSGKQFQIWVVGEKVNDSTFGTDVLNWGYVRPDLLRRILSSTDIFLYPTRHEGLPLMPLEAMACGCPTVLTWASKAIAKHKFNAWVAKIDDVPGLVQGIENIIVDKSLREKIIRGGIETAKRYSIERASLDFERHLQELCP